MYKYEIKFSLLTLIVLLALTGCESVVKSNTIQVTPSNASQFSSFSTMVPGWMGKVGRGRLTMMD